MGSTLLARKAGAHAAMSATVVNRIGTDIKTADRGISPRTTGFRAYEPRPMPRRGQDIRRRGPVSCPALQSFFSPRLLRRPRPVECWSRGYAVPPSASVPVGCQQKLGRSVIFGSGCRVCLSDGLGGSHRLSAAAGSENAIGSQSSWGRDARRGVRVARHADNVQRQT